MSLKTKRWNDPVEAEDGTRILVCRYRPRGLPRAEETWDVWVPDLGPSRELHAAFYGKTGPPVSWGVYRITYLREMRAQRERIAGLARVMAGGQTITLLCSSACVREERCHRSLLRHLIEVEIEKLAKAGW